MFRHQNRTNFPPTEKPVFLWDGQCGFCHFWIIRWKMLTGEQFDYVPYQKEAVNFPDISVKDFKEAVRFIETDGTISSGPAAAYRSLFLVGKHRWLFKLYQKSKIFKKISDFLYYVVTENRNFFFRITKILFGKSPRKLKPYWLYYLLSLFVIFFIILSL